MISDNKKAVEELYGITSSVEDRSRVVSGYGETINHHGAKTKEVQNVSEFPQV